MKPIDQIRKFAMARERAYQISGHLIGEKMRAISRIKMVAEFYCRKDSQTQLAAIRHCEQELMTILPSPHSRFGQMREKMIQLIEASKSQGHEQLQV